jgi:hypothetical protein
VNHFDEDVDRRVFRDDIPSAFWEERRTNWLEPITSIRVSFTVYSNRIDPKRMSRLNEIF